MGRQQVKQRRRGIDPSPEEPKSISSRRKGEGPKKSERNSSRVEKEEKAYQVNLIEHQSYHKNDQHQLDSVKP